MSKRVLALSSSGGHWLELLRTRDAFRGSDVAWSCTRMDCAGDVAPDRFHVIPDVNRRGLHRVPMVAWAVFRVLLKERPAVVVTTGAMPGLIALILAKSLFGCRTVWIDSVANVDTISGSGSVAAYFADAHLTQWPHLSSNSRPEYWGAVL